MFSSPSSTVHTRVVVVESHLPSRPDVEINTKTSIPLSSPLSSSSMSPASNARLQAKRRTISAKSLFLGRNYGRQAENPNDSSGNSLSHHKTSKHETATSADKYHVQEENKISSSEGRHHDDNRSKPLPQPGSIASQTLSPRYHKQHSNISTESYDTRSSIFGNHNLLASIFSRFRHSSVLSTSSITSNGNAPAAITAATNASNAFATSTQHEQNTINRQESSFYYDNDEQYLTSYGFGIFKYFKTNELNQEYSFFSSQQRSLIVVCAYALFFTCSLGIAIMAPFRLDHNHNNYSIVFILGTISWIMNLIDSILIWTLVYRQTNHCILSNSYLPNLIKLNTPLIQFGLLMTVTFGYCTRLLARTISGECPYDERAGIIAEWNCNPYHKLKALPNDTTIAMMFTPIAYPAIFRECRMDMVMLSFICIMITFIIATFIIHSTESVMILCMYLFLVTFIAIECPRQSLTSFLAHKKFQQALLENQKMVAQTEIEMRHVLGNVAHDFKTVSLPYYYFILCLN